MILKRPAFIDALIEQAAYLGHENPGAVDRFIDAVEATFAQLERHPELGRVYETDNPRLAGLRVLRVKGFRQFLIFYRPHASGIEALHLLHGARDIPGILESEL